jgi:hypothetical protein
MFIYHHVEAECDDHDCNARCKVTLTTYRNGGVNVAVYPELWEFKYDCGRWLAACPEHSMADVLYQNDPR